MKEVFSRVLTHEQPTMLLVEDDPEISKLITLHLTDSGFKVNLAQTGAEAIRRFNSTKHSLIILDLMIPEIDGFGVCRKIREEDNRTPIIFLTCRSDEIDRVLGLELGGDDYVTKPFSFRELVARVRAVLRRCEFSPEEVVSVISCGELTIDSVRRKVSKGKTNIELTAKEFDLLWFLAASPGRAYSRENLLIHIWGYDYDGYNQTVNTHVNRLRSKIEDSIGKPRYVLTVRGIGYCFNDALKSEGNEHEASL